MGEGCFGIAFIVYIRGSSQEYVMKIPKDGTDMAEFQAEFQALLVFHIPLLLFLVALHFDLIPSGFSQEIPSHKNLMEFKGFTFVKKKLCLLTKYYKKGSIDQILKKKENLLENDRFDAFR